MATDVNGDRLYRGDKVRPVLRYLEEGIYTYIGDKPVVDNIVLVELDGNYSYGHSGLELVLRCGFDTRKLKGNGKYYYYVNSSHVVKLSEV